MQPKRISVSSKRQITIPLNIYNQLGIDTEVECFVKDNALVLKPVRKDGDDYSEEILRDLVSQGLSGEALLSAFSEKKKKMRKAVETLIEEADQVASGKRPAASFEDIFGSGA